MRISPKKKAVFHKTVWDYYKKHKRDNLPWRKAITPYKVFVSEIMLQQTQVDRVIPFFKNWMKKFPTMKKLADANQTEILKAWKGLGYNSRALRMKRAAQVVTNKRYEPLLPTSLGRDRNMNSDSLLVRRDKKHSFPTSYEEILELPGVGPYTAGAICAFAYNEPRAFIETNIRRVYLHHFFSDQKNISDKELLAMIEQALDIKNPREWYFALMDYGSHLGTSLKLDGKKYNPNTKSRHYAKQSKFEGSDRQIRGAILGILLGEKKHKISLENLLKKITTLSHDVDRVEKIVDRLCSEGFVLMKEGSLFLRN